MGVDPRGGTSHPPEVAGVLCGLAALGYDGIAAAVPVVCEQTGLNTAELAIQVGLPPQALLLWQQGSFIPRTHHLLRLATVLATHQPQATALTRQPSHIAEPRLTRSTSRR